MNPSPSNRPPATLAPLAESTLSGLALSGLALSGLALSRLTLSGLTLARLALAALALVASVLVHPGAVQAHRVNIFAYADSGKVVTDCFFSRSNKVRGGLVIVTDPAAGKEYLRGRSSDEGAFVFDIPPEAAAGGRGLKILLVAGEGHQNETTLSAEELAAAPRVAPPGPSPAAADVRAVSAAPAPAGKAMTANSSGSDGPAAAPSGPLAPVAPTNPAAMPTPVAPTNPVAMPTPAAPTNPAAMPTPTAPTGQAAGLAPAVPTTPAIRVCLDEAAVTALVEAALERKLGPVKKMLADTVEKGPGPTEIVGGIGYIVGLFGLVAFFAARRAKR